MGRAIQSAYGQPPQSILTMPLLPGTDGVQKMSKSVGNQIGITEPPGEIYGKTLSVPDAALPEWYALLLGRRCRRATSPRDAKRALARALVERFHGAEAAREAEAAFDRVFVSRELPEEIEEAVVRATVQRRRAPARADRRPVRRVALGGAAGDRAAAA